MKLLDWAEHQVNWVRKLFRSYWFSKLCFSSTVSLLCGLTMNTVWGSLQLKAAALEERSPEVISIISQIGDSFLLRAQSHNLSHSAIAVKLCRLHFFIIGFYPSNCCSLLLWHSVAHLSLCGCGSSLLWLRISFFPLLPQTSHLCLLALCCNSSKCRVHQYFISKCILLTNFFRIRLQCSCQTQMCSQSTKQICLANKVGDFMITLFKFRRKKTCLSRTGTHLESMLKNKGTEGKFVWHLLVRWYLMCSCEWSSHFLQNTWIAMCFKWCCPCNVLHDWLQSATFALLHSQAGMQTRYTYMQAVCANVICRLCTLCRLAQAPAGANRNALIHRLLQQVSELRLLNTGRDMTTHAWKNTLQKHKKKWTQYIFKNCMSEEPFTMMQNPQFLQ